MKKIFLKRLELNNFKCHRWLVIDADGADLTLRGDNATGKTTVYDALCWVLFGTDSHGNSDKAAELKPLNVLGEVRDHKAVTSVEAVLTHEGKVTTLRRSMREVWGTKRGAPAFEGHEYSYSVDGVPMRKGEYEHRVGKLVPEEVFRLLTGVRCFSAELDWRERRRLLFALAAIPEDSRLLNTLPQFAPLVKAMGGDALADLTRRLKAERKALQDVRSDTPARISEQEKTLAQMVDGEAEPAMAERNRLAAELSALRQRNRRERGELERQLARLEREGTAAERARLGRELGDLRVELDRTERDLRTAQEREREDRDLLEHLEREVYSPGCCPTCGQPLPPAQAAKAEERFRLRRQTERERLLTAAERDLAQKNRAQARLAELQAAADRKRAALEALPAEEPDAAAALRTALAQLDNDGEEVSLQQRLAEQERILARHSAAAFAKQRLEQLRQEDAAAASELLRIDTLLGLAEEFLRYKTWYIEDSVNGKFRLARFRLFREQANGALEERCDVTFGGVPFGNLNNGAQINVGMDIIHTLSRHFGVTVPLVVDNAESVTRLEEAPGQLIRLVVDGGEARLKTEKKGRENYGTADDFAG